MTEIIVYRNPFEAAFWNLLSSNGGVIFPLIMGLVAFFISMAVVDTYFHRWAVRISPWWRQLDRSIQKEWDNRVQFTVSTIVACAVIYWLWL